MEPELQEVQVSHEFRCGQAGTGKTYLVKQAIATDPKWGLLTSTTGISAINLDTVTLNSSLGYFDSTELEELAEKGDLLKRLRGIAEEYRRLCIDEVSMMDARQLTILTREADKAQLPIYLTGDFLQLPPVKADWAFKSPEWPRYEANTTKLTKVWRQDQGVFLDALNHARGGRGGLAADLLTAAGVQWHADTTLDYPGTTLKAKNADVDQFNQLALDRLTTEPFTLTNRRWGRQRVESRQIPDQLELKPGAMVMLLSNHYDKLSSEMLYANGDCGTVADFDGWSLRVKLYRNGRVVDVQRVMRSLTRKYKPRPWFRPVYGDGWTPSPHWNNEKNYFVEGQLHYWPVRLAYASTIHKAQGMSLDAIQLDIRDQFMGQPAMLYTGLSRVRRLEGLRIVGTKDQFVARCKMDPRVARWA